MSMMFEYKTISRNGDATTTCELIYKKELTLKEFIDHVTQSNVFRISISVNGSWLDTSIELEKRQGGKWVFVNKEDYLKPEYIKEELYNKKIDGKIMYNGGYGQNSYWFKLQNCNEKGT